jgi:hypothetical protein
MPVDGGGKRRSPFPPSDPGVRLSMGGGLRSIAKAVELPQYLSVCALVPGTARVIVRSIELMNMIKKGPAKCRSKAPLSHA